ncbi:MAG: hypothetical protein OEV59_02805 [Deltaproteobacteria bacterium]|nr:hypothetical protein [Deltaproteobacteria bacterium]
MAYAVIIAFSCSALFSASTAAAEEGMTTTDFVPVSGTVVDACSVDATAGNGLQVTCTNSAGSQTSVSADTLLSGSGTAAGSNVDITLDPKTLYETKDFDSFSTAYSPGLVEESSLQKKGCGDKTATPAGVTVTW